MKRGIACGRLVAKGLLLASLLLGVMWFLLFLDAVTTEVLRADHSAFPENAALISLICALPLLATSAGSLALWFRRRRSAALLAAVTGATTIGTAFGWRILEDVHYLVWVSLGVGAVLVVTALALRHNPWPAPRREPLTAGAIALLVLLVLVLLFFAGSGVATMWGGALDMGLVGVHDEDESGWTILGVGALITLVFLLPALQSISTIVQRRPRRAQVAP